MKDRNFSRIWNIFFGISVFVFSSSINEGYEVASKGKEHMYT